MKEWHCLSCQKPKDKTEYMIIMNSEKLEGICCNCVKRMVSLIAERDRENRLGNAEYLRLIEKKA